MADSSKAMLLAKILLKDPREGLARIATILEYRTEANKFKPPAYNTRTFEQNVEILGRALNVDLLRYWSEPQRQEISDIVSDCVKRAHDSSLHAGDHKLAGICFALCRATKPQKVVETGVSYGATTAFILQAMEMNGVGELYSVDLPPLGAEANVGTAVPEGLRKRWNLFRGDSRSTLPVVLKKAGEVDLFIHDSLHTYRNESFEFSSAWPYLRPGGVLVSDDIEAHPAWQDWERAIRPDTSVVFQEDDKVLQHDVKLDQTIAPKFGVMLKPKT